MKPKKLSPDKVQDIRKRRQDGEKCLSIAYRYGIGVGLVSMIANKLRWKHVE